MTRIGTFTSQDELDHGLPVPSPDLRARVTGISQTAEEFREQGLRTLSDWQLALRVVDREIESYERLLDFGCGCGRVTRHLSGLVRTTGSADRTATELHGCDIDGDAIEWAAQNLPDAHFVNNDGLPPLPYADGYFDLVVNHSVFTHLPEDYQDAWLNELRRVVRPGGHLLLSVAGTHAFDGLVESYLAWPADPSDIQRTMHDQGILYISDDSWNDSVFPDWYHSTFHTPNYIQAHWGTYFRVRAHLPRAALEYQDIIVLERTG